MKKVNEIVNFLLGKEKRAYAVAGAMLEGAPIEHPLSTHSAPIGTSRKPAGIKAIIRCMAAMFVMLFILGVGNAWGANLASLRVYSNTDVWGKVNRATNTTGSTPTTPSSSWAFRTDSTKTSGTGAAALTNIAESNFQTGTGDRYTKNTYTYCAYAKAESGCEFVKWEIYNGTSKIASTDMNTVSTTLTGGINRLTITNIKGNTSIPVYYVKAIFKTNTKTITCDQPTNGSYTVNNGTTEVTVPSGTSFEFTPGNDVTLTATPIDGKSLYRWYYRAGNDTRVVLTPKSSTTTDNVTTAVVTIPNDATAIGAEFDIPEYTISFERPNFLSYTYTHMRGNVVQTSGTRKYNDADATIQITGVRATDKIILTHQELNRGDKFRYFYKDNTNYANQLVVTTNDRSRTYPNTNDIFTADCSFGAVFEHRTQHNITYLAPSLDPAYFNYTAVGTDPDGGDYPTITVGSSTIITCESDEIELNATIGYGYKLVRWYLEDSEHTKYTIPDKGNKAITALNPTISTALDVIRKKNVYGVGVPFDRDYSLGAEVIQRPNPLTVSFETAEHGTYTASGYDVCGSGAHPAISVGGSAITTYTDNEISLNVTGVDEGYSFVRFYAVVNGKKVTLGEKSKTTQNKLKLPAGTTAVGAEFSDFPFVVDGVGVSDLKTALQIAQGKLDTVTTSKTEATVIVTKNATVEPGNYTIPAKVTLLIPYASTQSTPATTLPRVDDVDPEAGEAYSTLTLSDGVHIEVYGTIEVSGQQATGKSGSGGEAGLGCPTGDYGCLYMGAGSSITLNNGALLRGWGFVLGDIVGGEYKCEIDARRGSIVREQFQMMDWKGGTYTEGMTQGCNSYPGVRQVLPVNQYYIQNVEVPVKYRPGAKLQANASVYLKGTIYGMEFSGITINIDNVGIIGAKYNDPDVKDDQAIFLMDNEDDSEDTWVRKSYNVAKDQQVYDINNAASLGSLVLNILNVKDVSSTEYKLPITNNFKIHLLSGDMVITQNTEILPSAEIEIDKESVMTIPDTVTLYLWDKEDWGDFVSATRNPNGTFTFAQGTTVRWRPGGRPTVRRDAGGAVKIDDAKLIMHGSANVYGYLKTTAHGASITSTVQDAGTIIFFNNAPADAGAGEVWQVQSLPADNSHEDGFISITCTSAQLKNEGGTVALTGGTTATEENPISFCYLDFNGVKGWKSLTTDECFVKDENRVYYIKPQGYVPISVGEPEEKPDHTYRDDYAGTGRIFILAAEGKCQWWEVEPVEGHPELFEYTDTDTDNHTFYYYDDRYGWMEKKFNVTFKNWNDTTLKYIDAENHVQDHYELPYNSHPQWLSDNPTRSRDAHNTYEFDGWYPEITPSTVVTGDVVFMAKYVATPREYLITFKNASGAEIETKQCAYGSIPEAPDVDMTNKKWSPAIGAVTGNQVYQLVAATSTYTVTYKNWDGSVLKETKNIASGADTPDAPEATKAADQLNSYTFAGWSPEPTETVTADAIYTATFNTVAQTYAINFFQEDGETQIGDPQNLAYGAMPSVPSYSKEATTAKTYTLVWSPLVSAATKDQNYVATFTEQPRQYTVTWKKGEDVIETNYVDYGTTPVYSGVTPTNEEDPSSSFNGWYPTPSAVSGDQVYTAQFTSDILTISNTKTAAENETVGGTGVTTVVISKSGTVDLRAVGSKLEAENLILESDGSSASGQLIATNEQVTATNIYFDFKVNAKNHKWYGVAVPWEVDATTGISVNGKTLVLGKDFDIVYYNGALRAEVGKQKCWSYVEDDVNKTLQPGRLYMIGLMMDAQTIRFEKSGASILTTTTSVTAYSGGAASTDQGWNGVANPAIFHAFVNPGVTAGQVFKPEDNSYGTILLDEEKFVVGQGAFVQAPADKDIEVSVNGTFAAAPRRVRAEEAPLYDVRIAPAEAEYTDRLFVRVEDEKEADTYVIGKDLEKLGVSKSVAQMWINRYNTELCLNTMTMENGAAEYPLGIFAPKAGEYTIAIHNSQFTIHNEDYALYLTLNGEAIWNLSDAAYTGTFDAGTTSAYGLRISARAPQITTGIDEAVVDAKGETRKVLIDNQVFIIRGENVYSVDGQIVK